MEKIKLVVSGHSGLHARPAGMLVAEASKYRAEITIEKDERAVNAKSIIGILSLGASNGDSVTLVAEGDDEKEAIQSLSDLITNQLAHV